jgi:hypothetical protein
MTRNEKPTTPPPPVDLNKRLLKHAQELRTLADCIEAVVERAGITKADLLGKVSDLRRIAAGILTGAGQMVEEAEEVEAPEADEPPCPFHSAGNTGPCSHCEDQ